MQDKDKATMGSFGGVEMVFDDFKAKINIGKR